MSRGLRGTGIERMIVKSSIEAQETRRRALSDGTPFYHTTFIGQNRIMREALGMSGEPVLAPGELYPMAFLVEQDPGTVVRAHFHRSDQWQVVIGGSGHLASHPVGPVTLHYTNAHSAYGPIKAGSEGVAYFTLRNGWDPGARYMPEGRTDLRAAADRVHREAVADPEPPVEAAALANTRETGCRAVIPPAEDGVGAWRYTLAPGGRITGPDPATGAGQYWLVLRGTLEQPGNAPEAAPLPARSLLFVAPDDAALAPIAGPGGAEIVALQFPRR